MKHPRKENAPSGKGRILTVDTEAVGLLNQIRPNDPSSIHVICAKDMQTDEKFYFFDPYEARDPNNREVLEAEGTQDGYLLDGVQFIKECDAWSIHNGSGYDTLSLEIAFPDLWKVNNLKKRGKDSKWSKYFPYWMMDTYVMSTLLNPDRKPPPQAYALGAGAVGPHSIAAHGIRMGRYKPENEDWSKLTDHMLHRVGEDVEIGADLFWWLARGEWQQHMDRGAHKVTGLTITTAYGMELQVALAMTRQQYRGFRLDIPKSYSRFEELQEQIQSTEAAFRPHMPQRIKMKSIKQADVDSWADKAEKALAMLGGDTSGLVDNLRAADLEGITHSSYAATNWNPTNKDGSYSKNTRKYIPEASGNIWEYGGELWQAPVCGPFTPLVYEDIPLGNRDTVKQVLYQQGWRGVNFNDAEQDHIDKYGNMPYPWSGKIDEKSIELWRERQAIPAWAEGIASWYILSSRSNQILNSKDVAYYEEHGEWPRQAKGLRTCRGLLPRAYSSEYFMEAQEFFELFGRWPTNPELDGEWRVPAVAISIGTNTFRMRHRNVVNIPSRGLYPLRDLFIAGAGKMVLGCDGSGLELRMLAHFMNDAMYTEVVLNGDIHAYNQELAGLPTRDMAKTFIYAFLYGSGLANLASVTGLSIDVIGERVEEFKSRLPTLASLIESLERVGRKFGHLLAVDARWGRIRFKNGDLLVHTILNVLLQMTGSLCMKWGLVFAEDKLLEEGVGLDHTGWPAFLANVHDEIQMEVNESEVLERVYRLPSEDWKAEEKAVYYDEEGRMWSAPRIIEGNPKQDEDVIVRRRYHRAGQILAEQMTEAGKYLGIRIPLAGEYMLGYSWSETH